MPSVAWQEWATHRAVKLDEIEAAHRSVGGTARGRRFATEQINHAYAVLLASQFQGFCRDLHTESGAHFVREISPAVLQSTLRTEFLLFRSLDRGNATPGAIGTDYARFGLNFWARILADASRNDRRKQLLDELNLWRNAIAHQDFDPNKLGGTSTLQLQQVRVWRSACEGLARSFDSVMRRYLIEATGQPPW